MPLMHCMDCHHEWENYQPESLCDWCDSGGYVLSEKTSLDTMMSDLKDKKVRERLLRDLTGEIEFPRFQEASSFVETPADRIGENMTEEIKEITDDEVREYMDRAEEHLMNGETYGPMDPELEEAFDSIINKQWDELIEKHGYEIGISTCGIDIETTEGKAKVLIAYSSAGGNLEEE